MITLSTQGQEKLRNAGLSMIEVFEAKHNTTNGAPGPTITETSSGKAAHVEFIDQSDGAVLAQEELYGSDLALA
tara:strand:- start:7038 stop:7259 length:222 start_codon:yes stop_codon:yes gene_type:complete